MFERADFKVIILIMLMAIILAVTAALAYFYLINRPEYPDGTYQTTVEGQVILVESDPDLAAHIISTAVPEQLERLNSVMRELTTAGPAVLADAAGEVVWRDSDFWDPMHFSAEGSARMARFMADIVEGISHDSGGTESGSLQQSGAR